MSRFQEITVIITAAIALSAWGAAIAQEQTGDGAQSAARQQQQTTVQQRTMSGSAAGEQNAGAAGATHTRRLGPGDGTGNQGARPSDGTGFGSPGRLGRGSDQTARGNGSVGKNGTKGSTASPGATTRMRQNRARSLTGSGPGGSLCDGTGRRSSAGGGGSARRGGGRG